MCLCCVNLCFLKRGGGDGIQPERLNAEGDSLRALSRGWSVSVTPGIPSSPRKASERRESSSRGSRYSRSSHNGGRHDTEGYASLHPRLRATRSARAFDLSGCAAAIFWPIGLFLYNRDVVVVTYRFLQNQAQIFTLLWLSVPCKCYLCFLLHWWCSSRPGFWGLDGRGAWDYLNSALILLQMSMLRCWPINLLACGP